MQKKLQSKILYKGSIFTLTNDTIEIENGMICHRDIIHHHGGCAIIAQKEDKVLLISQYRYAVEKTLFEIPAGKIENKEEPYDTAMRELNEECGYACHSLSLITAMYSTPGFCNEKIYIYEAKQLFVPQERKAMDEDECISVHWIPLQQAYHWIQQGKIVDAKTIIAIQYAMLKKQIR